MPTVFSSSQSSILVDGETIDGVQSLAFRTVAEREDVRAVGTSERVAVVFGLRLVQGELAVRSASYKLDGLLKDQTKFQLVASLKQDNTANSPKRTLSFDECYVEEKEFTMGAGGSVTTTYVFTATRLREE
jgi:hypothetical protein